MVAMHVPLRCALPTPLLRPGTPAIDSIGTLGSNAALYVDVKPPANKGSSSESKKKRSREPRRCDEATWQACADGKQSGVVWASVSDRQYALPCGCCTKIVARR